VLPLISRAADEAEKLAMEIERTETGRVMASRPPRSWTMSAYAMGDGSHDSKEHTSHGSGDKPHVPQADSIEEAMNKHIVRPSLKRANDHHGVESAVEAATARRDELDAP
jgi:hypothetical protein